MKIKEQNAAKHLRSQGKSIKEIARELNVSSGSVSLWVRDIKLTKQQEQILLARNPIFNGQSKGNKKKVIEAKKLRHQYQDDGIRLAKRHKMDHLFSMGCALYWGEGAKNKWSTILANTDVDLLKIWLKFLQKYFSISNDKIAVHIYCWLNNGLTAQNIESYWLCQLNLPKACLRKTVIHSKQNTGFKRNKHPHGACRIAVYSVELTQKIFGAIRNLASIEQERWID